MIRYFFKVFLILLVHHALSKIRNEEGERRNHPMIEKKAKVIFQWDFFFCSDLTFRILFFGGNSSRTHFLKIIWFKIIDWFLMTLCFFLTSYLDSQIYQGVWKSQKKSHSTLWAKRTTFTFWVDKTRVLYRRSSATCIYRHHFMYLFDIKFGN